MVAEPQASFEVPRSDVRRRRLQSMHFKIAGRMFEIHFVEVLLPGQEWMVPGNL